MLTPSLISVDAIKASHAIDLLANEHICKSPNDDDDDDDDNDNDNDGINDSIKT